MDLKSDNVFIAIIILISIMLICHTAHFFYDKNNFNNIPLRTQYNQIYYDTSNPYGSCNKNKANQDVLDQVLGQSEVPCLPVKCPTPTVFSLDNLSDSEIAVIYKVAYENAGIEVLNRVLQNKI